MSIRTLIPNRIRSGPVAAHLVEQVDEDGSKTVDFEVQCEVCDGFLCAHLDEDEARAEIAEHYETHRPKLCQGGVDQVAADDHLCPACGLTVQTYRYLGDWFIGIHATPQAGDRFILTYRPNLVDGDPILAVRAVAVYEGGDIDVRTDAEPEDVWSALRAEMRRGDVVVRRVDQ